MYTFFSEINISAQEGGSPALVYFIFLLLFFRVFLGAFAGTPILDTDQKALKINLDESIYGTFAEIGAGQEVAREQSSGWEQYLPEEIANLIKEERLFEWRIQIPACGHTLDYLMKRKLIKYEILVLSSVPFVLPYV